MMDSKMVLGKLALLFKGRTEDMVSTIQRTKSKEV